MNSITYERLDCFLIAEDCESLLCSKWFQNWHSKNITETKQVAERKDIRG